MDQSKVASSGALSLNRYEIFEEIAAGGMASVHLARMRGPEGFSKIVAVKRMHPYRMSDPRGAAQLVNEARMAARISHPNVVSTLDIVVEDPEVMLVMEYVHGESLAGLARNHRHELIPVPIAVAILIDGLHGLHAAHESTTEDGLPMGLVHRDISPQNLLVGADGITKVADFGIAKAALSTHDTTRGVLKGKLGYMAPEQVQSLPVSRRADIFGAAVSLWEVLTGRRLFQAESQAATVHNIMSMPILPPSEFRSEVPADLDRVVLKGLAREPSERFESAREMALALEAAVAPVRASQIASCVTHLAGSRLETRRRLIAEIEGGVSASSPPPVSESGAFDRTEPNEELAEKQVELTQSSRTRTSSGASVPSSWGTGNEKPGDREPPSKAPSSPPGEGPDRRFAQHERPLLDAPVEEVGAFTSSRSRGRLVVLAFLVLGLFAAAYVVWGNADDVIAQQDEASEVAVGTSPLEPEQTPSLSPGATPPADSASTKPPAPADEALSPDEMASSPQDESSSLQGKASSPQDKDGVEQPTQSDARLPAAGAPVTPKPRTAPRPVRVPSPSQPKPNCDPPFSINAQGHRIFKPECM